VNKNSIEILAKPSGITLDEHVSNVILEAKYIESECPFLFEKYQRQISKSLLNRLVVACKYHDDGKAGIWQQACLKDYYAFKIWEKTNNGDYQAYEMAVNHKTGENIRKAGVRHEFESLRILHEKVNMDPELQLIIEAAIAAHHSKLGQKHEERWEREGVRGFWGKFKKKSYCVSETDSFQFVLREQYKFAGPRSLLQFADRRASAKEAKNIVPSLKSFSYTFPHESKRGVQKLIEQNWKDDLLLVRAPTGAGKTDASLLWASLQIENKKADRLIIAMPTRFTSNALAINVAETLSDTGLYHSSAWFAKFSKQIKNNEIKKYEAAKIHELARLLYTPITVCTIDHLLIALTLSREDHHQICFNLANSCLVIDEADFYDDFTQANILILLEALKEWNVPVLLMSASLPESILTDYREIGYKINHILEDNSDSDRIRFSIKTILDYENIDEIGDLLELCIIKGAAIIYVNTVDKAMLLYNYFQKRDIKSIVYHSRFTEPDKNAKEDELIQCLGKDAWKHNKAKGIAILTQIGEMSINISADLMISELCPIDRLTQRAGRLCRFDKNKIGVLHIINPHREGELYPPPYGEYNRREKKWIPVDSLVKTKNVLQKKKYSPKELVVLLNDIYAENPEKSALAINNASILKDSFIANWLINPVQRTQIDDSGTNFWKSRNIMTQDTIFVVKPNHYFNNYNSFQEWKIENSIEIPVYLIEKFEKNHILDTVMVVIRDEKEYLKVIKEGFYDFEKGVFFDHIDEQIF